MKNNAFKHTFWIGITGITLLSFLTILIGINVHNFLEDTIESKKTKSNNKEESFPVDDQTQSDSTTKGVQQSPSPKPKLNVSKKDTQPLQKEVIDSIDIDTTLLIDVL